MAVQRERILRKLKWHGGELSEPFFLKRKMDALQNILRETELITDFELFILDVFREIFSQLIFNGTTKFSKHIVDSKHLKKRADLKKGLLLTPYSRTKSKSKSVDHTLIKG